MQNVGTVDRALRIIIGLALIVLTFMGILPVWGYIGVVPLATGLVRWCPAYTLFGVRTCATDEAKPST
ncbi:MAG: DUF2892 domain-containing protein [Gammaproteobacteria bacterium]|nr:DUF2892 domain-containing protein [Gammaproteobacteria bacterium]